MELQQFPRLWRRSVPVTIWFSSEILEVLSDYTIYMAAETLITAVTDGVKNY